jgi:hypothetical protein
MPLKCRETGAKLGMVRAATEGFIAGFALGLILCWYVSVPCDVQCINRWMEERHEQSCSYP